MPHRADRWSPEEKAAWQAAHPVSPVSSEGVFRRLESVFGMRCPVCYHREWRWKFTRRTIDEHSSGNHYWGTYRYTHKSCGASWTVDFEFVQGG
jgi:hypothetical protein